jgi:tetratricopeptide (TPR) repeat protein
VIDTCWRGPVFPSPRRPRAAGPRFLIREVEDSSQRGYPDEYRRLHVAAFEYFAARDDVLNGVYHLLVLDEQAARSVWVQAIDQARLGLDLDSQRQLLGLLQMPERIRWLQPHTRAFHSLFAGLLARYQDRLDDALTALEQAAEQFRTAGDSWGVATATQALGDLYVRTARLDDALTAYEQALPTYQEIHARLGEANTLQGLGRFHSIQGSVVAAEEAFAAALDIYDDIADRYSLAATLAYRGQHRLVHRAYEAGTDWGTALALSIATDPFLARQIIALTVSEARSRCLTGQDDELVAAAMALLLQTAEQTADSLQLAEDQSTTLSIVLETFRVIGAICAYHTSNDQTERDQYATTARSTAQQVDMITSNTFGLVAVIHQRLAAGSADEQAPAGSSPQP